MPSLVEVGLGVAEFEMLATGASLNVLRVSGDCIELAVPAASFDVLVDIPGSGSRVLDGSELTMVRSHLVQPCPSQWKELQASDVSDHQGIERCPVCCSHFDAVHCALSISSG